jgi:hypothetical protein
MFSANYEEADETDRDHKQKAEGGSYRVFCEITVNQQML